MTSSSLSTHIVLAPQGVSTLDFDPEATTLDGLKVLIFSSTDIPPSEQDIKYGYPPKPLPSIQGSVAGIIGKGEQLIISSVPTTKPALDTSSTSSSQPTPPPPVKALNQILSAPSPLPTSAPSNEPPEDAESIALPGRDAGFLQLRVVPDDNSCLFSAVSVIFEGGIEGAMRLRKVAAEVIKGDVETYSEVMLGMPREEYMRRILKPETWGGAIELSIFAKHYKTEIASFDVATGRCDRFGHDEYSSRCLLVYSGIHYDAITLSPLPSAPSSFHTTVFPTSDDNIFTTADKLISQLRARHYYTDTANFDLRCGICKIGLKGEKGAREHAMATGHVQFGEY